MYTYSKFDRLKIEDKNYMEIDLKYVKYDQTY